jgi:hypothetical protein
MATYYNFFKKEDVDDDPTISVPYIDEFGLGE